MILVYELTGALRGRIVRVDKMRRILRQAEVGRRNFIEIDEFRIGRPALHELRRHFSEFSVDTQQRLVRKGMPVAWAGRARVNRR